MFSWTRIPLVNPGDPITSRQAALLAQGVNERILSGIGNGHFRIAAGHYNLWRQFRNPAADAGFGAAVFPSQGEFPQIYMHVEPEDGFTFPTAGPGEFEGANLASPMPQFVWGVDSLPSEEDRLNEGTDDAGNPTGVPLWMSFTTPPSTLEDFWELGKRQRGAIEPDTGTQFWPAGEAAQSYFQMVTPYFSPMGKSYGSYYPTPSVLDSDCGDLPENGLGVPSLEIFFTGKRADVNTAGLHGTITTNADGLPVCTYAGSCPLGTLDSALGHVVGMRKLPLTMLVAVNDGAGGYVIDHFPRADWIEGPYENAGALAREDGGQIDRAVWNFAMDFRGTSGQRDPDDFDIEEIAFGYQEFNTTQYYLAPNIAQFEGGGLKALYPTARITTAAPNGTFLSFDGGGTTHTYREGFVCCGVFARAKKLARAVSLEVLDDAKTLTRLTLEPDGNGDAEALLYFDGITPSLRARLQGSAAFTGAGGEIRFEANELVAYKPQRWDLYVVLRLSATHGGDFENAGVDGRGLDETAARDLWENYARYGCIPNVTAAGVRQTPDWINDNPVFDTARRFARENYREWARQQFVSYEVAGGKSILRFKRYLSYPGIPSNTFDCFKGIAPAADPLESGALTEGETYVVRGSGTIWHHGRLYNDGQTFLAGDLEFRVTGDAEVFVYEGIRKTALPKGFSNRWSFDISTNCYHPSDSSLFKAEAYADWVSPLVQRCHVYSGSMSNAAFNRHVNYGYSASVADRGDGHGFTTRNPMGVQANYIAPEAPDAYNYAHNANVDGVPRYKSCQIYRAPYEIDSATIEFDGSGTEIVKLVMTRVQTHESAPATVDRDPLTWDGAEVDSLRDDEEYRTLDNALREYCLHLVDPSYQCSFKIGDSGSDSGITMIPDNPFGSCYPKFYAVRLVPEPFQDDNDIQEDSDSRAAIDLLRLVEFCICYMSEGFLDGITSLDITCKTESGSLFDYKYETICFDGFQGSEIGAFSNESRPDVPGGFGPIPNTFLYAEVYNRAAACLNLMTRARVFLPFVVECNQNSYTGSKDVSADWPSGPPPDCIVADQWKMLYHGSPAAADTLVSSTGWLDCGVGASIQSNAAIDSSICPDVSHFSLFTQRVTLDYRVAVDTDALYAIPESWRSEVQSIGGFIGRQTTTTGRAFATPVAAEVDSTPCGIHYFWDGSSGYAYGSNFTAESECKLFDVGSLNPGTPPGGAFADHHIPPSDDCGSGSSVAIDFTIYTEPGFFVTIPLVDA